MGKTRHVEVKFLWLQQAVRNKRLAVAKVWGKVNPADHLTKAQTLNEFREVLEGVGGRVE